MTTPDDGRAPEQAPTAGPPNVPYIPGGAGRGAGRFAPGAPGLGSPTGPVAPRPYPAAVVPLPPPASAGAPVRTGTHGPQVRSPLWFALATVVGVMAAVALFVTVLATVVSDGFDDVADGAGAVALVLLLAYLLTVVPAIAWVATIGINRGSYGPLTVLNLVCPIWILAFAIFGEIGLAIGYVVYFCWPVRLVMVGLCAAAKIPQLVSFPIWCAGLAGTLLGFGVQVLVREDPSSDAAEAMAMVAMVLHILYAVFWLVALLMATIIQHLDISADRQLRRAA